MMKIYQIQALKDNYNYILHDERSRITAVVDPSEAAPIVQKLEELDFDLDYILHTHHHRDHIGGDNGLVRKYDCEIVGPSYDSHRIPGMSKELKDGDTFLLGESAAKIFFVPGHTLGHIAYYFAKSHALFCGDVIFSLGSGFLFEGTPDQMWNSLKTLRSLPEETRIFCAHEYTLENAEFAMQFEKDNKALQDFVAQAKQKRARGEPTVPSLMKDEIACNPFLRADLPKIKELLGDRSLEDEVALGKIRHLKNVFKTEVLR